MADRHVADAEAGFKVVNITPDFCKVGPKVVPFDIYQRLPPERSNYAKKTYARGEKILRITSVVKGIIGNAGSGIISGVSQGAGNSVVIEGAKTVRVEGELGARHRDLCNMNVSS